VLGEGEALGYAVASSPPRRASSASGDRRRGCGGHRAYGGLIDKFPMGAVMNRGPTIKGAQCHVQRYMRPLLERVQNGKIDPSFVVLHHLSLDDAPRGYDMFKHKEDECVKVVLKP
jgi:threonine dehydrogenase-like Zn-dependent dehydrogenase